MLSIVIPVFNGEKNITPLIKRLSSAAALIDGKIEIIFIDDNSSDESLSGIKKAASEMQGEKFITGWISLAENAGQQAAVLCGLRNSRGDYIITMDDDLEHPPEMIPALYSQIRSGQTDAVYAVPEAAEASKDRAFRKTGSLFRDLFFVFCLGKPAKLRIGSFRIFSRKAADKISESRKPFVYISAEFFRSGFKAAHIVYKGDVNLKKGRYSAASRIRLYLKLILWYGIRLPGKKREQYRIKSKGGCL